MFEIVLAVIALIGLSRVRDFGGIVTDCLVLMIVVLLVCFIFYRVLMLTGC